MYKSRESRERTETDLAVFVFVGCITVSPLVVLLLDEVATIGTEGAVAAMVTVR